MAKRSERYRTWNEDATKMIAKYELNISGIWWSSHMLKLSVMRLVSIVMKDGDLYDDYKSDFVLEVLNDYVVPLVKTKSFDDVIEVWRAVGGRDPHMEFERR